METLKYKNWSNNKTLPISLSIDFVEILQKPTNNFGSLILDWCDMYFYADLCKSLSVKIVVENTQVHLQNKITECWIISNP